MRSVCKMFVFLVLVGTCAATGRSQTYNHHRVDYYLDDAGREQPVKTDADWQKRRQAILAGMQEAMGKFPSREKLPALDIEVLDETKGEGYLRRTLRFVTEPGDRLTADLYLPIVQQSKETRRPAMLALHPTGPLGKRIVAGEGPRANRAYGTELAQRGYVVLAPDYPSFGDAKGYDFAADRYSSGTMKGIWNHMRCVDFLEMLPEVDAKRIGVIGHSLGGHNAMFVAAFDERLKVIVTSCGWTPFHDYYGGKIAGWTSDRYMPSLREKYELNPDKVPFDFYEVVAALAPRAFFSNSPISDDNFAVDGVKKAIPEAAKIYSLFDAEKNLQVRYPPCGHDFPTETREEAYKFIDQMFAFEPVAALDFSNELPRIPPRDPQAGLKSIAALPGYRVELVAAEPLVTDPVAMCFDPNANLYVIEMRDYSEQDKEMLGRVRFLEDVDGDGKYDRATIFADKLSWPTAICCYDGGVFVGAPPDILYLKDTDGDHRADVKQTVFAGFGRSNVQGLMNSFRWGLDSRIHGATSSSGGMVVRPDVAGMKPVDLRGRDFSFDPKLLDLRPEAGGAQHGMCFDDWGRKYCCSNSDHLQVVMYDDRYAARNPVAKGPPPRISIAADGGQAPVFRRSPIEPWRIVRTRLRVAGIRPGIVEGGGTPAGYFTGATGVTIYRGDALPEDRGRAFVGDVGSNLVHRKRIVEEGLVTRGERIDKNTEFLAADDIWFRPVQFANAPDGALYVLDMSREVIEHPASLPPEIKQHLDLTSGREQGRIYRIVPDDFRPRPVIRMSQLKSAELVPLLAHVNAWQRETAAQLLFERQDKSVVAALEKMVTEENSPLGRMHAQWVLRGLQTLRAEVVAAALKDADPHVREHAVRLAEAFPNAAAVRVRLAELADVDENHVRFQLAFTIGEFPSAWRAPIAAKLLTRDGTNEWLRFAVFTSLSTGGGETFAKLTGETDFLKQERHADVLAALAEMIGRQAQEDEVGQLLAASRKHFPLDDCSLVVRSLSLGLAASKSPAAKRIAAGNDLSLLRQAVVAIAHEKLANETAAEASRITAARTLSLDPSADTVDQLALLLDGRQPVGLQFAALQTLAGINQEPIAAKLISRWSMLTPDIRKEVVETLLSREAWTTSFLSAIEEQKIPRSEWNPARLALLKTTASPAIAERVAKILAANPAGPRNEVVERYRAALSLAGDADRGRAIFRQHCAACHQLEGHGQPIGPNLAAIKNRGSEAIVLNVFDPNREVNPDFLTYTILTTEGRSVTGVIASQSATGITLKRPDVKEETILRQDIEAMKSTGLSLMPEGFEKQVTVEQLADLVAYLMK